MTNVWPATLPQYVSLDGYSEKKGDLTIRTKMDAGNVKARRRFTARFKVFDFNIQMTAAQYALLETFHDVTLADGTLPFDWVEPITQTARVFMFTAPLESIALGGNNVRAKFQLQTVP